MKDFLCDYRQGDFLDLKLRGIKSTVLYLMFIKIHKLLWESNPQPLKFNY